MARRWARLLRHAEGPRIYLATQKVVTPVQNLVDVKRLVLLHLLLHEVLHDARVEVLAGLLVRDVVLLRVVQQRFAVLVLVESRLSIKVSAVALARILAHIAGCAILVVADSRVVLTMCRLCTSDRHLVHQDHLCKLRSVLEALELGIKQLRSGFDGIFEEGRILRKVVATFIPS